MWRRSIAVVLAAAACKSAGAAGDEDVVPLEPIAPAPPPPVAPAPPRELIVLVNTADTIFRVDPETLALTELGRFDFVGAPPVPITDIAMDRRGRMWGVGFGGVYTIDPATFETRLLADVPPLTNLNALGVVTASLLDRVESPDVLLAAGAFHDRVYEVDPVTGAIEERGALGGGLDSSGDITWAPGVGAVILAKDRGAGTEGIARLEPGTLRAIRAPNGFGYLNVLGLAPFAKGRLFGVTDAGEILVIDPVTGTASLHSETGHMFFGAAVGWASS